MSSVRDILSNTGMIGGDGENSYAKNSRLQGKTITMVKSFVNEALRETCKAFPEKIVVADLGCSSGPNSFLVISEIINAVCLHYCQPNQHKPEIQFFLNDLPSNDFNTIFQLSVLYKKQINGSNGDECVPLYIAGLPGSFYGRLFLSNSVHFFHSSYSLMWLSQVPKDLIEESGSYLNKAGICINTQTSPIVSHWYLKQFKSDFSEFLKARSKELISGGTMILSILGRRKVPSIGEHLYLMDLLLDALNSLIYEGLVEEEKLLTFNLPVYVPLMEELKLIIDIEGSFHLAQMQSFESNWDPFDDNNDDFVEDKTQSGNNVAKLIRALLEPLFASHFGNDIIEDLFSRYAKNVERHMAAGKPKFIVHVLSLKLKD